MGPDTQGTALHGLRRTSRPLLDAPSPLARFGSARGIAGGTEVDPPFVGMSLQRLGQEHRRAPDRPSGLYVPQTQGVVVARRGHEQAIGAEVDGVDVVAMAAQRDPIRAPGNLYPAHVVSAGETDPLVVGVQVDPEDRRGVLAENSRFCRRQVPDTNGAVDAPGIQLAAICEKIDAQGAVAMPAQQVEQFAGAYIPDAHRTLTAPRGEQVSVGADVEIAELHHLAVDASTFSSFRQVPETDGLVLAARGQQRSVGAEAHTPDHVLVSAQHGGLPRRGHLPHANGPVHSARSEQPAVGAERRCCGPAFMIVPDPLLASALHAPQAQGGVVSNRRQALAVWAERRVPDTVAVPTRNLLSRSRVGIPNPQHAVVAPRRQKGPVWSKGNVDDRMRVPLEGVKLPPSVEIPEPHGFVVAPGNE